MDATDFRKFSQGRHIGETVIEPLARLPQSRRRQPGFLGSISRIRWAAISSANAGIAIREAESSRSHSQ
jgi:hypothetical protein